MNAPTVLALDAGQTATKVAVRAAGQEPHVLVYSGVLTHEPLLPQLAAIATDVTRRLGSVDFLTAGVSGLTSAEADARGLQALVDPLGRTKVVLAHDSVTSYLGALGARDGAVVAAGTGVVTLAVGPQGVARVDGWGNIMGDAGSAYWIGRAGLEAVMRAHDGRAAATDLSEVARQLWPALEEAYIALQGSPDRIRLVASFAQEVARLAPHDDVARGICVAAAHELALSVVTALRRAQGAEDRSDAVVCALGGVFQSAQIRSSFEEALAQSRPGLRLVAPEGDGLFGALALADLPQGHPLWSHVSVA